MTNAEKFALSEEQTKIVIDMYNEHHGAPYIHDHTGFPITAIYRTLKKNGVKIRSDSEKSIQYSVNEDFFENIDAENKAYWLGFFYADGYVSSDGLPPKVGITLSSKDIGHLEKFANDIETNVPISVYKTGRSSFVEGVEYARVLVHRSKMRHDLIYHGVVPQKTNILLPPFGLPNNLERHFIRGMFDGDGCFWMTPSKHRYNVDFMGTMDVLTWVCEKIDAACGFDSHPKFTKRKPEHTVLSVRYGGKNKARRVLDYMYSDSTIFLDRKHERYVQFTELSQSSHAETRGVKSPELLENP